MPCSGLLTFDLIAHVVWLVWNRFRLPNTQVKHAGMGTSQPQGLEF